MTREKFIKVLDYLQTYSKKTSAVYDYGVDLLEFSDELHSAIGILLKEIYTEEGYDWITWFMYEKDGREDMKAWDENGKEICNNKDELYEYLTATYLNK